MAGRGVRVARSNVEVRRRPACGDRSPVKGAKGQASSAAVLSPPLAQWSPGSDMARDSPPRRGSSAVSTPSCDPRSPVKFCKIVPPPNLPLSPPPLPVSSPQVPLPPTPSIVLSPSPASMHRPRASHVPVATLPMMPALKEKMQGPAPSAPSTENTTPGPRLSPGASLPAKKPKEHVRGANPFLDLKPQGTLDVPGMPASIVSLPFSLFFAAQKLEDYFIALSEISLTHIACRGQYFRDPTLMQGLLDEKEAEKMDLRNKLLQAELLLVEQHDSITARWLESVAEADDLRSQLDTQAVAASEARSVLRASQAELNVCRQQVKAMETAIATQRDTFGHRHSLAQQNLKDDLSRAQVQQQQLRHELAEKAAALHRSIAEGKSLKQERETLLRAASTRQAQPERPEPEIRDSSPPTERKAARERKPAARSRSCGAAGVAAVKDGEARRREKADAEAPPPPPPPPQEVKELQGRLSDLQRETERALHERERALAKTKAELAGAACQREALLQRVKTLEASLAMRGGCREDDADDDDSDAEFLTGNASPPAEDVPYAYQTTGTPDSSPPANHDGTARRDGTHANPLTTGKSWSHSVDPAMRPHSTRAQLGLKHRQSSKRSRSGSVTRAGRGSPESSNYSLSEASSRRSSRATERGGGLVAKAGIRREISSLSRHVEDLNNALSETRSHLGGGQATDRQAQQATQKCGPPRSAAAAREAPSSPPGGAAPAEAAKRGGKSSLSQSRDHRVLSRQVADLNDALGAERRQVSEQKRRADGLQRVVRGLEAERLALKQQLVGAAAQAARERLSQAAAACTERDALSAQLRRSAKPDKAPDADSRVRRLERDIVLLKATGPAPPVPGRQPAPAADSALRQRVAELEQALKHATAAKDAAAAEPDSVDPCARGSGESSPACVPAREEAAEPSYSMLELRLDILEMTNNSLREENQTLREKLRVWEKTDAQELHLRLEVSERAKDGLIADLTARQRSLEALQAAHRRLAAELLFSEEAAARRLTAEAAATSGRALAAEVAALGSAREREELRAALGRVDAAEAELAALRKTPPLVERSETSKLPAREAPALVERSEGSRMPSEDAALRAQLLDARLLLEASSARAAGVTQDLSIKLACKNQRLSDALERNSELEARVSQLAHAHTPGIKTRPHVRSMNEIHPPAPKARAPPATPESRARSESNSRRRRCPASPATPPQANQRVRSSTVLRSISVNQTVLLPTKSSAQRSSSVASARSDVSL
ncbi:hypothetical protein DIPPA_21121 [Diplonema papillatum]|nr:hypothetical protein DIPPA_21121 [Diplonema papillatum]